MADLDDKTSNNKIGEIVNLSQELNSLLWDMVKKSGQSVDEQYEFIKDIYYDVCQLDVLSNIEIDKAKKEYPVDTTRELKKTRKKYENILIMSDGRKRMPYFLGFIAETKNYKNPDRKDYQKYYTSMDYLHNCMYGKRSGKSKGSCFLSISDIFKPNDYDRNLVDKRHVKKIIQLAEDTEKYIKTVVFSSLPVEDRNLFIQKAKENLLYDINKLKLNKHTMYRLLWNLDRQENSSIKNLLFYVLFNYKNELLTDILCQYDKIKTFLIKDPNGEIVIYEHRYSKKTI